MSSNGVKVDPKTVISGRVNHVTVSAGHTPLHPRMRVQKIKKSYSNTSPHKDVTVVNVQFTGISVVSSSGAANFL